MEQQTTALDKLERETSQFIQEVYNKPLETKSGETTESIWHGLVKFFLDELGDMKEQDPVVYAVCTSRVKEEDSLRRKIKRLQEEEQKGLTRESLREMHWDIAGTRVCLYFPRQLSQVRKFIEDNEHFQVIPQKLKNRHRGTEPLPTEFVTTKEFREHGYTMKNQETRPYKERMGYYNAHHYWIRLKRTPKVQKRLPNYDDEVCEIQIRTVLMDAWAEVRHDLDYKHILGYPSEGELRALDAIKGVITSCEIMQDHLFMLREQRITRDTQQFAFKEPKHFWEAFVNALLPKHRLLLVQFGHDAPPGVAELAARFFQLSKIDSPKHLKDIMAKLVVSEEQEKAMVEVKDAFTMLKHRSPYLESDSELDGWWQDPKGYEEVEPSLFRFVAVFCLTTMKLEDIQSKLYHDGFMFKDSVDSATWSRFNGYVWPSMREAERDGEENYCDRKKRKQEVEFCAFRWYHLLRTALEVLVQWLSDCGCDDADTGWKTVSTTWHICEWIATIYQDYTKIDQIVGVVGHFYSSCQNGRNGDWDRKMLRLCGVLILALFETKQDRDRDPESKAIRSSDLYGSEAVYLSRLSGIRKPNGVRPRLYESEGAKLAADIVGVAEKQLRHATFYRALFQLPEQEEYVKHRLQTEDIDENWQEDCGISILGAVAAFGTDQICDAMLGRRGANVNLAFSDGLSIAHIAVIHANETAIRLLRSNPNFDVQARWEVSKGKHYRAGYWTEGDIEGLLELWRNAQMAWRRWESNRVHDPHEDYGFVPSKEPKSFCTALELAEFCLDQGWGSRVQFKRICELLL